MSQSSSLPKKLKELEEIVEWFEQAEVDIEAGLKQYQKGSKLVKEISTSLDKAENTIKKIQVDLKKS